jgi:hypothetical protein
MGYIIALVILLLVVPLLFIMLSRRTTSAGGLSAQHRDRGMTVESPSSDQPTPGGDNAVNQPGSSHEGRLPPG